MVVVMMIPSSSSSSCVKHEDAKEESQLVTKKITTTIMNLKMKLSALPSGASRFDFRGSRERTVEEQIRYFSTEDYLEYKKLVKRWEESCKHKQHQQRKQQQQHHPHSPKKQQHPLDLTPDWHLRFLRTYTRGRNGRFAMDRALAAEKKFQHRYLKLNAYTLEAQLHTKTLFPVPGLKTVKGHAMFYMRPSRYFPKDTPSQVIIDNLCYTMNCILDHNESAQTHGIGFIANMDDWTKQNFDISYCLQFMNALQGHMVPVKVESFLIVNPPSWFGAIWRIMRPMLTPSFRRKVKICQEAKLHKYLAANYRHYLPDDMRLGTVNTEQLVQDFILYRRHVERDLPAAQYCDETHEEVNFQHRTLGDLDETGYFYNHDNHDVTLATGSTSDDDGRHRHHNDSSCSHQRSSNSPMRMKGRGSGGSILKQSPAAAAPRSWAPPIDLMEPMEPSRFSTIEYDDEDHHDPEYSSEEEEEDDEDIILCDVDYDAYEGSARDSLAAEF